MNFSSLNRSIQFSSYTHADFLRKIEENPAEQTPHLVYADWLEEQGYPGAAEVVRRSPQDNGYFGLHMQTEPYQPHVSILSPSHFQTQSGRLWAVRLTHLTNRGVRGHSVVVNSKNAHDLLKGMQGLSGADQAIQTLETNHPELKEPPPDSPN